MRYCLLFNVCQTRRSCLVLELHIRAAFRCCMVQALYIGAMRSSTCRSAAITRLTNKRWNSPASSRRSCLTGQGYSPEKRKAPEPAPQPEKRMRHARIKIRRFKRPLPPARHRNFPSNRDSVLEPRHQNLPHPSDVEASLRELRPQVPHFMPLTAAGVSPPPLHHHCPLPHPPRGPSSCPVLLPLPSLPRTKNLPVHLHWIGPAPGLKLRWYES